MHLLATTLAGGGPADLADHLAGLRHQLMPYGEQPVEPTGPGPESPPRPATPC
ncbi:hypothetical protein ACFUN8_05840 [Streptomyces sp. NPDC057307]|uniref:hypothetical protein n=1 Tax=Streptomyces sp. NPDC057307 TaxID=3346096 RepID=UPI0036360C57